MDKIDRTDYRMYLMAAPLIVDMLNKFDELVEGYNEIMIMLNGEKVRKGHYIIDEDDCKVMIENDDK